MIDQLTQTLSGALTDLAEAAVRKCAVFAVIGLVLLTGAGFLLAAVYMALAASFGAIVAAITLGGTLITLGLIALAIIMQRDPGDAIDRPAKDETSSERDAREDDVLFDLLIHSAMTGYATGQGNHSKMKTGFDQMVTDLDALGVFGRKPDVREPDARTTDTTKAG